MSLLEEDRRFSHKIGSHVRMQPPDQAVHDNSISPVYVAANLRLNGFHASFKFVNCIFVRRRQLMGGDKTRRLAAARGFLLMAPAVSNSVLRISFLVSSSRQADSRFSRHMYCSSAQYAHLGSRENVNPFSVQSARCCANAGSENLHCACHPSVH